MTDSEQFFSEFTQKRISTGSAEIFLRTHGGGPPVLLLHGYPETHAAWCKVAPALARDFTVVAPDNRGYGASSHPESDSEHRAYSKRTVAAEMVEVMRQLGFECFHVVGHDRGARAAYRMALDHPTRVASLVLIDIVSTFDQWQLESAHSRMRMFHWPFLAQPAPLPESLIGNDPKGWLEGCLKRGTLAKSLEAFDPTALADYHASFADADRRHASCEDYRAGATCDVADDRADRSSRRRIICPTLAVQGTGGSLSDVTNFVGLWQNWCTDVVGRSVAAGHYIPQENPAELVAAIVPFLKQQPATPPRMRATTA